MKTFIAIILILVLLLASLFLEQRILAIRKQEIHLKRLPEVWSGLGILQISDIHHRKLGRGNRRIIYAAEALHPDFIVITGDLVSRDFRVEKDLGYIWSFLTGLRKVAPVFICLGNHELYLIESEKFQPLRKAIEGTGCRLLDNDMVYFDRQGDTICIAGASMNLDIYRNKQFGYRLLFKYTCRELVEVIGERKCFTILLAHNPVMIRTYADWGADLALCGHMHGGMIRLPGVGGLLSPERKFFPKYDLGLYQNRSTYMYVSGGIGKLRLFNPPEINMLYLYREKKK